MGNAQMMLGVTALILEKAITEPTLCPMYALLCSDLDEQLWSTNLSEPSEREKITFKRVLLNYCQEAFESTINLQDIISQMDSLDQRPKQMQRMAKLRPLKNICLFMGELYKVKLVTSRIVSSVIKVLLEQDGNTCFLKENVEAVCQLFNSIDERIYDSPLVRKHMDPHINHLTSLAVDPELGPQLRPMVRDVLCLRLKSRVPEHTEVVEFTSFSSSISNVSFAVYATKSCFQVGSQYSPQSSPSARSSTSSGSSVPFSFTILSKAMQLCLNDEQRQNLVKEAIRVALNDSSPCMDELVELLEFLTVEKVLTATDITSGCLLYWSVFDEEPAEFGKLVGKLVSVRVIDMNAVEKVLEKVDNHQFHVAMVDAVASIN
ncbi:Eukaryotic translation initiation factor isoform 4G-2 [Acorus calamus]|uniref:Eukaryotic translation initiation factor isoform 4G-2 n=1 Tax=Acorus calamus TaxID=4465 RepID=A0AAV9ETX8_ACOCL|nr:Eukaryotic translation initiation factor isoform 4G-2 [Acorus calamus]